MALRRGSWAPSRRHRQWRSFTDGERRARGRSSDRGRVELWRPPPNLASAAYKSRAPTFQNGRWSRPGETDQDPHDKRQPEDGSADRGRAATVGSMPDSIEPIAADLALGEVTVPDGNGAPLGRDVALLFLTRAIRMF